MSAFEYIMVVVAIIIGLGITQLLSGVASLIQHRDTVRIYWVHLVWVFAVFLFQVELWWGWWGLRHIAEWQYIQYFRLFLTPIVLYVLSVLAVPRVTGDRQIDLHDYYYNNNRWFFGVFALYPVSLFLSESLFGDQSVLSWQNAVRLVSFLLFISCAWLRNRVFHAVVAILLLVMFAGLIAPRLDVIR